MSTESRPLSTLAAVVRDVTAFVAELVLWGAVGVAGHVRWDWPGGIAAVVLVLTLWSLTLAPRARHRLPLPARVVAIVALGCVTAVLVGLGSAWANAAVVAAFVAAATQPFDSFAETVALNTDTH